MNHALIVDLAQAIHGLRPDWQQPGIVAQLKTLDDNWPGSRAALYVHAITVAANPAANTPAALNAFQISETIQKTVRFEQTCYICNLPRPRCNSQRVIDESHGLETHHFETREDAELRTSRRPS